MMFPQSMGGGVPRTPPGRFDHVTAIIGNLGFLYNLRTGVIHVRIISSLKERTYAR